MGSYIFHISILLYRWLEFPYSKSLYGLMGYVINDLMLDIVCYFYLIWVSWCGCYWSYYASEATNVLVLYTYRHDVFFLMRCFSNLWAITIIYFYMRDYGRFLNGFFLGSSTCRTDCLLSLCIVGLIRLGVVWKHYIM
jgi:hypothetical protein